MQIASQYNVGDLCNIYIYIYLSLPKYFWEKKMEKIVIVNRNWLFRDQLKL